MRKDIHPAYQQVLFHDTNADAYFLIGSTLHTKQTKEYLMSPLIFQVHHIRFIQVKYVRQAMKVVLQASTNALLALAVQVNLILRFTD